MTKQLIMVMGVQRSGTTALFMSLAQDRNLMAYMESKDSPIYRNFRLRPEMEIRPLLMQAPGPVLLKPISETVNRSVNDVFEEYQNYHVRVVWIYRDPENVFYSMHRHGWIGFQEVSAVAQIQRWNRRNQSLLDSLPRHRTDIAVVAYEDLIADPRVFVQLTEWLGVNAQSLFRSDKDSGRAHGPLGAQVKIDFSTRPVRGQLNAARTWRAGQRAVVQRQIDIVRFRAHTWQARVRGVPSAYAVPKWDRALEKYSALEPSQIPDLLLWLSPELVQVGSDERIQNVTTTGLVLQGQAEKNGPYRTEKRVGGKPAILFPNDQSVARQGAERGRLCFENAQALAFLYEGKPFTVFAMFQPMLPEALATQDHWMILLRVSEPARAAPSFVLSWNASQRAAAAILLARGPHEPNTINDAILYGYTPPASHPWNEWRIVCFRHALTPEETLQGFANTQAGVGAHKKPEREYASTQEASVVFHLGGGDETSENLFYGAVGEILIFRRALEEHERLGITRYLRDKYKLA